MSNNNDHNNDKNNDNVCILFVYKSTKYKFDINSNSISPVYFNLSLYHNKTIIDSFMDGINTPEKYKRSIDTYGKNILKMNSKVIYQNLLRKDLPNCAVVCFSGGLCLYCKFLEFGGLLCLLAVLILIIKYAYRFFKFIKKLGHDHSLDGLIEYKVKRKYLKEPKIKGFNKVKNIDLVPGDIISLTEGEIIPCDCILLDGECILSESKMIGKVDTIIKSPLKSDNDYFNYKKNKYCILFHGMEIVKVYSKNFNKNIISLVINTGVNTFKANELSNLLYENIVKEKNQEIYTFFVGKYYLIFIAILSCFSIFDIITSYSKRKQDMPLVDNVFIVLCFAFMPIYYLASCYITFLGIFNLNIYNNQDIQCIDESRLIESGKINQVIFDKTGTLTENKIEISAFIPL
jgi:cation-transporting ATPase 13A3/4/5